MPGVLATQKLNKFTNIFSDLNAPTGVFANHSGMPSWPARMGALPARQGWTADGMWLPCTTGTKKPA
jgi:hypothetical protein